MRKVFKRPRRKTKAETSENKTMERERIISENMKDIEKDSPLGEQTKEQNIYKNLEERERGFDNSELTLGERETLSRKGQRKRKVLEPENESQRKKNRKKK